MVNCKRCGSPRTIKHSPTPAGTIRRWCQDCKKPYSLTDRLPGGSKPLGDRPMTGVERVRKCREKKKSQNTP